MIQVAGETALLLNIAGKSIKITRAELTVLMTMVSRPESAPPAPRSYWVDRLLPISEAEDLYANIDEVMPKWLAAHGERRAWKIRSSQLRHAVVGYYFNKGLSLVERVKKIFWSSPSSG